MPSCSLVFVILFVTSGLRVAEADVERFPNYAVIKIIIECPGDADQIGDLKKLLMEISKNFPVAEDGIEGNASVCVRFIATSGTYKPIMTFPLPKDLDIGRAERYVQMFLDDHPDEPCKSQLGAHTALILFKEHLLRKSDRKLYDWFNRVDASIDKWTKEEENKNEKGRELAAVIVMSQYQDTGLEMGVYQRYTEPSDTKINRTFLWSYENRWGVLAEYMWSMKLRPIFANCTYNVTTGPCRYVIATGKRRCACKKEIVPMLRKWDPAGLRFCNRSHHVVRDQVSPSNVECDRACNEALNEARHNETCKPECGKGKKTVAKEFQHCPVIHIECTGPPCTETAEVLMIVGSVQFLAFGIALFIFWCCCLREETQKKRRQSIDRRKTKKRRRF